MTPIPIEQKLLALVRGLKKAHFTYLYDGDGFAVLMSDLREIAELAMIGLVTLAETEHPSTETHEAIRRCLKVHIDALAPEIRARSNRPGGELGLIIGDPLKRELRIKAVCQSLISAAQRRMKEAEGK